MKFLHITVDESDPVTQSILQQNKSKWTVLTLHDFIKKVNIYDECNASGVNIKWQYNKMTFCNDKKTILYSRICHFPQSLFQDFSENDREYAQSEMEAYLGFALNSFNKLDPVIDERGCIPCYSLPQQWQSIKSSELMVAVPKYYWGDPKFNHLDSRHLVYSGIYEYNMWSIRKKNDLESNSVFCFERPNGIPMICFVINGNVMLLDSKNNYMGHHKEIKDIARQLAKIFNYFLCEILLFVDLHEVTIGCISPYVIQSHANNKFSQFVNDTFWEVMHDKENNIYS